MNDLTTFTNPEFGAVRTVELNGTPWLVGKDIAAALGYSNARKAISDHVDAVNDAKKQLSIARKNHDFYAEQRSDTKDLLAKARALHAQNCDRERKAAQVERDWQNYLDAQIDQLRVVAVGLPGFDEIMETAVSAVLPEKKKV